MVPWRLPLRRLGLLLGLFVPSTVLGEGLFRGGVSFPYPGSSTTKLLVGDLDRDGRTDLLAGAEAVGGRFHVFLGDTDRVFTAPTTYRQIGNNVVDMALGLMDGDAYPDVLTLNSRGSISVYLNAGDGSLGDPSEFPVGSRPRTVALSDFDGDGDLDAASGSLEFVSEVTILLGDGQGFLGAPRRVDTGDNPHWVLAGDYDGDLVPDLMIAVTGGASFHRGFGDGSFGPAVLTEANRPQVLSSGDVDGDGLMDFSYVGESDVGEPGNLGVLFNLGNGSFRLEALRETSDAESAELIDFSADGLLDILVRSDAHALHVHEARTGGLFEAPMSLHIDVLAAGAAVSDLDSDGAPDLLVARQDAPEVRLYNAVSPGELGLRSHSRLDEKPVDLVQVRGHGILLAASARKLHALDIDPRRRLAVSKAWEVPESAFLDTLPGDFDGDGFDEVALADTATNRAFVVSFEGPEELGRMASHSLTGSPAKLAAGDLDGDGSLDLAVSDLASPAISVIRGPLLEDARVLPVEAAPGQKAIAVSDLDGDGDHDIALSHGDGLELLLGDGKGVFDSSGVPEMESAYELRAGDIDGDGRTDLVGTSRSRIVILRDVVPQEGRRRLEVPFPEEVRALEVVDIDEDGRLDLLTATRDVLQVVRSAGAGGFSEPEEYRGAGFSARALVAEDVDGDGNLDVAIAAYQSQAVVTVYGSTPGAAIRRGDANGDGGAGITDAIMILESLFRGAGDLPCPDAGDADDNGRLEITDPVYLLLHLFLGGPAPPAPGPEGCGLDPTPDGLFACRPGCSRG